MKYHNKKINWGGDIRIIKWEDGKYNCYDEKGEIQNTDYNDNSIEWMYNIGHPDTIVTNYLPYIWI